MNANEELCCSSYNFSVKQRPHPKIGRWWCGGGKVRANSPLSERSHIHNLKMAILSEHWPIHFSASLRGCDYYAPLSTGLSLPRTRSTESVLLSYWVAR